jgi:hypothetical protein
MGPEPSELDRLRLSVQVQVLRVILMVGTRALLDGKLGREAARQRNHAAILDEIARRFEGTGKANGVVTY